MAQSDNTVGFGEDCATQEEEILGYQFPHRPFLMIQH